MIKARCFNEGEQTMFNCLKKTNNKEFANFKKIKSIVGSADSKVKLYVIETLIREIINRRNYDEVINTLLTEDSLHFEHEYTNEKIVLLYKELLKQKFMNEIETPIERKEININQYALLLNPWKRERVEGNIAKFKKEKFDYSLDQKYEDNLRNYYVYPMNFVLCEGGNHSQYSALNSCGGQTFTRGFYDFSNLYEYYSFSEQGFITNDGQLVVFDDSFNQYVEDAGILFYLGKELIENGYVDFLYKI